MIDTPRRSLSPEEHAIRLRFDAAKPGKDDAERARLWTEMKRSRARGARAKARMFVRVRLNDGPVLAACLVSDLKIVSVPPLRAAFQLVRRVEAHAPCELLFGPETPLCKRAGPCPHDVVVYVLESDNEAIPAQREAYESLRVMLTRRPRMHTP